MTHIESIVLGGGCLNGERVALANVTMLDNVVYALVGATVIGTVLGDLYGERGGVTDTTGIGGLSIGPVSGCRSTLWFA